MKEILLTRGKVALVDDEDYPALDLHKWYACKDHGGNWYAVRAHRGRSLGLGLIHMHRVILQAPQGLFVDHRDRDGLNNQKQNLRLCNKSQNGANAKRPKHNTSGFKGVHVFRQRPYWKTWRATIYHKGKSIVIGAFVDPADAARAYDKKAKELFGEFARLNFPEPNGESTDAE